MSVLFPDVPLTDGVPPVLRSRLAPVVTSVSAMLSDSLGIQTREQSQWGIYDESGTQVLVPETVIAFEMAPESLVADYPIEGGGFESYNKVQLPFSVRLMMEKVGSKAERSAFLDMLENMRLSTELFDVMTPEKTYLDTTLERYELMRSNETGPQVLRVEVVMREVRLEAQVTFTNEESPNAVETANAGSVQATTPAASPTGAPS